MSYNDKLNADDQISAEESIAAHLFDNASSISEEEAAELGRSILLLVLRKFRPDLIDGDDHDDEPWSPPRDPGREDFHSDG